MCSSMASTNAGPGVRADSGMLIFKLSRILSCFLAITLRTTRFSFRFYAVFIMEGSTQSAFSQRVTYRIMITTKSVFPAIGALVRLGLDWAMSTIA